MDLSDPKDARKYISRFRVPGAPSEPTYLLTNTGKRIEFATMTDEEACLAAHLIHDLVLEARRPQRSH